MSKKFWSDGICHICDMHSLAKCDSCQRFCCDSHSKQLKQGNIRVDVCKLCLKKIKPGMKIAGVKITKKALES